MDGSVGNIYLNFDKGDYFIRKKEGNVIPQKQQQKTDD